MNAALPSSVAPPLAWPKALVVNIAIWIILSGLGTLTSMNDELRFLGVEGSPWLIFVSSCRTSAVLACLSFLLYLGFGRWPGIMANARTIACGYGALLLVLLPLQLVFVARTYLPGLGWAGAAETVARAVPAVHWTAVTAVYFAVVALKTWQQSQARAQAWAKAQADALALSLKLEQQRGLALRAQLEPHFVFNALNAISAMVRTDRDTALDGIQGLSDLLRYALAASERDWVKVSEELAFVEDYLTLQRMRYGARLRIAIEGASAAVLDCDCPPLLLQPLVENALRHDLDCHDQPSDILLSFARRDGELLVCISNPVHGEAVHNPGVGLGLRNIEARLKLAYGIMATMRAGMLEGRFQVSIAIPEHAPD
jgi:two-component system sensor histidine kinase AlgZ